MNTYPITVIPEDRIIDMQKEKFATLLRFTEDEKICFYHSLDKLLFFNFESFILLTNKYLYKYQLGEKKCRIPIENIVKAVYKPCGLFNWDKISCHMRHGTAQECGVYFGDVAKFLTEYINYIVVKNMRSVIISSSGGLPLELEEMDALVDSEVSDVAELDDDGVLGQI